MFDTASTTAENINIPAPSSRRFPLTHAHGIFDIKVSVVIAQYTDTRTGKLIVECVDILAKHPQNPTKGLYKLVRNARRGDTRNVP